MKNRWLGSISSTGCGCGFLGSLNNSDRDGGALRMQSKIYENDYLFVMLYVHLGQAGLEED